MITTYSNVIVLYTILGQYCLIIFSCPLMHNVCFAPGEAERRQERSFTRSLFIPFVRQDMSFISQ